MTSIEVEILQAAARAWQHANPRLSGGWARDYRSRPGGEVCWAVGWGTAAIEGWGANDLEAASALLLVAVKLAGGYEHALPESQL